MSALDCSARLSDVCRFQNGGTPSKSIERYFTGDIPWITGADLIGPVALQARSFITEEAIASSATNQVPAGTVLLVTRTSVGKVAIAGMSLCFSQDITALTPDAKKLSAEYLVHFLRTKQEHLTKHARGATIQGITREVVADLEIPLPPLEEQRRITAILDQAETLRTQRRQALAHLDTLTQSLFLEMFGDPMDLPKCWTFQPMADLFETSPIFGTMIPGDAEGGPWLCLRVANIQDWQLTLEDRKYVDLPESAVDRHSVRAGDLLMARAIASQDHLGKCIVAQPGTEHWAFDSHLMRLRFRADRALPDFIRQMLRTPGGRKLFLKASRKSSVQYNINTKEISALEIPVPPIALQQTFATRIQAIEALKATHRTALAQLDALFASLQQRAFAGEL